MTHFNRRQALVAAASVGLAVQLVQTTAFAGETLGGRKLVVVIARGGLDGLSLSPPVGDPSYAALRGPIAIAPFGAPNGALRLDGTFGLHPSLAKVHELALAGEARIAPAIATPDRERSHFEAQDVLESGSAQVYSLSSGWLNRALQALDGRVKAISVAPTAPLVLRGPMETASWSPGGFAQRDRRLPMILTDLYAHDARLGPALAEGLSTEAMAHAALADAAATLSPAMPSPVQAGDMTLASKPKPGAGPEAARKIGATLAGFMAQPGGMQIAAVSMDNFDTHANEGAGVGQLANRLAYVDAFMDGLHVGLGPSWRDTVVVMATEFGRTARVNGTLGTDHGTASTALLLGGALRRGGIIGDWPTLAQAALFEDRDTRPSLDMRSLFKGVLRDHLGVGRVELDQTVFPDSRGAVPVEGLIA